MKKTMSARRIIVGAVLSAFLILGLAIAFPVSLMPTSVQSAIAPTVFAEEIDLIYDETDLLIDSDIKQLGDVRFPEMVRKYNFDIRVDVVEDLEGRELAEYAKEYYDHYEYGAGPSGNDGVLLMIYVSTTDESEYGNVVFEDYYLIFGGRAEDLFFEDDGYGAYAVIDALDPYLNNKTWDGDIFDDVHSFSNALNRFEQILEVILNAEAAGVELKTVDDQITAVVKGSSSNAENSTNNNSNSETVTTTSHANETTTGNNDTASTAEAKNITIGIDGAPHPASIIDHAGLLTAQEKEKLEQKARAVAEKYEHDVAILVVDSIGDAEPYDTVADRYWKDGYGYGSDHSGILLLLSMKERKFAFICIGEAERITTRDYGQIKLEGFFLPSFKENRFVEGFEGFIDGCEEIFRYATEHNGTPMSKKNDPAPLKKKLTGTDIFFNFIVCFLIPIGIAFLFCSSAKSKMKTARLQRAAQVYIPTGGFELQRSEDVFLYKTETREKIESSSSSSGGSSSHSGGGGSGRSGSF